MCVSRVYFDATFSFFGFSHGVRFELPDDLAVDAISIKYRETTGVCLPALSSILGRREHVPCQLCFRQDVRRGFVPDCMAHLFQQGNNNGIR